MKRKSLKKRPLSCVALITLCLLAAAIATAQNGSFAGKYEGTAKGPNGDVAMKLELIEDGGEYSGQVTSPGGAFKVVSSKVVDGVLTIETEGNGTKATLTLRKKGDTLAGDFNSYGRTGPVEFKKAAIADEISGEWDAIADASGQPFPFALTLKLEGEKVTGSSVSQLGDSNISEGSWKDGKLAVILEGGSGKIALAATMIDGKLSGDYDYAGQLQGKWVAVRKK